MSVYFSDLIDRWLIIVLIFVLLNGNWFIDSLDGKLKLYLFRNRLDLNRASTSLLVKYYWLYWAHKGLTPDKMGGLVSELNGKERGHRHASTLMTVCLSKMLLIQTITK